MQFNVGLIGLGWFAGIIARALAEKGGEHCRLWAVCDIEPERGREFGKRFGIDRVYRKPEELVEDPEIDIVAIATPPHLHFELAMMAFKADKNVFLEKPGAIRQNEMEELIKVCRKKNLKATIDFVMRRNPLYFVLKMVNESKIFGMLERAGLENYAHDDHLSPSHWFWDYKKSGGIWVEHGVHFFDIMNWIVGRPEKVVAWNVKREGFELVERVMGFCLHEGGTVVDYYHGFTKPEPFEKTTFSFAFERAYAKVYGWIPVRLQIDALVTKRTDDYLRGEIAEKARNFLPGIDLDLKVEEVEEYEDERTFTGRGKTFRAMGRNRYVFLIRQDRWEVYRACVAEGLKDLSMAARGLKEDCDVTLYDAFGALQVALEMEKAAVIL
ncbi:Oxidoreductase family, C-terminal alpha/beta domain [Caldanaerovirga acetigignens]|uniref:Oxidoreductase family, C-terminal alpha/beta domain n=1 Tax=Caldanaerovirga acetigignens TaxID=447595 RepID=A0A1M7LGA1_9FIRM|nr:Gfo/Idh/MocA family oxidoreductase [Caldanaerovirga acetigignens]SHM77141.1 Oxidoreductase family, C-terminal alpha/beta domain [Caldanaerovirga acetigignens]